MNMYGHALSPDTISLTLFSYSVAPKHCKRLFERVLVLAIAVVPECLSNKALMRPIMTLISEIISLDIFPFVWSGKIQVLHISHDTCSPVEWAGSQKGSRFVIHLYFRDTVGFVAVLCSQSSFVFKMIASKWENFPTLRREMMIAENCSMGAQVFQTCCLAHSSIVSIQLLVLLCSWRQLLTLNLPDRNIYNIAGHIAHF